MSKKQKRGFTLMELLIVVIIIGVLAAIAVPQYQKAVLKSRYSALMPITKSLANGNEVYYMEHGEYASAAESLDVSGQDEKYPDGTDVDVVDTDKYSYVLATRDNNFPLNYIVYQKHSTNFPDNIHCEASTPMAEEVCQGLGGQLLESGSLHDGFTTYILKGSASDGQMPTSLSRLVAACEKNANCTVSEQGDNTTLQECEGDLTSTNIKTCTNVTYDEDGEQVGYEKTQQQCGQKIAVYVANGPSYDTRAQYLQGCITQVYDDKGTRTNYEAVGGCSGEIVEGKGCVQTAWTDDSRLYALTMDEQGREIAVIDLRCKTASSDGNSCIEFERNSRISTYTQDSGGNIARRTDVECTLYANSACVNYGGGSIWDYTSGTVTDCATANADGCITYKAKYSGSRPLGRTQLLCSQENNNINIYTGECL